MSSNLDGGKSASRAQTDLLLSIQNAVQVCWEENKVFEAEPGSKPPGPVGKFFGNFPYPYMNGLLHLGHAFSLSKLEFSAAYHRLLGSNVLLPFDFHCTGMPIKASADKLAREIQQYGNPPVFPVAEEVSSAELADDNQADQVAIVPDKFKSKKSKAAAKAGVQKFQWEIMTSFGLSDQEIAKFQDPYHWMTYFPWLAKNHLKDFGLGCDWRRSFVTTDMNPFYDAFVRWQMRKLKKLGKIVKDMRYTIYSPLDGQPCADHDRATSEGVQPQEYVLIKMEVVPPFPPKLKALEGSKVYLAAATLRPETMYGQTNCWVLPDGNYGAFEINDTDVFIMTARAALNLAYQHLCRVPEKPTCLAELFGSDLIGLPLKSPLAFNEFIYALPMLTILTDKGTGIVTSVLEFDLSHNKLREKGELNPNVCALIGGTPNPTVGLGPWPLSAIHVYKEEVVLIRTVTYGKNPKTPNCRSTKEALTGWKAEYHRRPPLGQCRRRPGRIRRFCCSSSTTSSTSLEALGRQ